MLNSEIIMRGTRLVDHETLCPGIKLGNNKGTTNIFIK